MASPTHWREADQTADWGLTPTTLGSFPAAIALVSHDLGRQLYLTIGIIFFSCDAILYRLTLPRAREELEKTGSRGAGVFRAGLEPALTPSDFDGAFWVSPIFGCVFADN